MRELYDDYEDLLGRDSKSHKSSSKTNDSSASSEAKTKTVETAKNLSSQTPAAKEEASSEQQIEVVANEAENGGADVEQECENNVESNGGEGVDAADSASMLPSIEDSTVVI